MKSSERALIISDTQEPFSAQKSIEFCSYVKSHFRVPDENCFHAGDENDIFHGGNYPKDGDFDHTPKGEISAAKERMKLWEVVFPELKLAISNHGLRWVKKAALAQIPSQLLRSYKEIFDAPERWIWKEEWKQDKWKHPWRLIHGQGYSGQQGARNAAIDAGISTAIGHLHSHAGISYIKTQGRKYLIWGMNVGCLIDEEQYAFKYGKYSRAKGCLGVGVVLDGGKMPIWVPYE